LLSLRWDQPKQRFRGQLSGRRESAANPVIHPICTGLARQRDVVPPEVLGWRRKFVLNSDRSNNTEAHENQKLKTGFAGTPQRLPFFDVTPRESQVTLCL